MSFFSIVPRDKGFLNDYSNAIPLKVVQSSGIVTKPNLNINVTDLSKGYKHFYNSGSVGITFQISVIIHKDEKLQGKPVTELLDEYIRSMTPLLIHTDAIDIPDTNNDAYIIIKNDNRKQDYTNYTEWDLEFITYNAVNVFRYKNDNAGVLKALKKTKQNNSKKSTKKASTKNAKLKKCNYKTLVYSKKKKVVKCVEYLQKVLKKNKCYSGKIDGWFGKDTTKAVKQFQKNYNKKLTKIANKKTASGIVAVTEGTLITKTNNNTNIALPTGTKLAKKQKVKSGVTKLLQTNGKVDKATWQALCKS